MNDKIEKRKFNAPTLEVYGRARDITRNVGAKGALDSGGGAGPKTRT